MVGTTKWTDYQVQIISELYPKYSKQAIVDYINKLYPRRKATKQGVTYVLNTKKGQYNKARAAEEAQQLKNAHKKAEEAREAKHAQMKAEEAREAKHAQMKAVARNAVRHQQPAIVELPPFRPRYSQAQLAQLQNASLQTTTSLTYSSPYQPNTYSQHATSSESTSSPPGQPFQEFGFNLALSSTRKQTAASNLPFQHGPNYQQASLNAIISTPSQQNTSFGYPTSIQHGSGLNQQQAVSHLASSPQTQQNTTSNSPSGMQSEQTADQFQDYSFEFDFEIPSPLPVASSLAVAPPASQPVPRQTLTYLDVTPHNQLESYAPHQLYQQQIANASRPSLPQTQRSTYAQTSNAQPVVKEVASSSSKRPAQQEYLDLLDSLDHEVNEEDTEVTVNAPAKAIAHTQVTKAVEVIPRNQSRVITCNEVIQPVEIFAPVEHVEPQPSNVIPKAKYIEVSDEQMAAMSVAEMEVIMAHNIPIHLAECRQAEEKAAATATAAADAVAAERSRLQPQLSEATAAYAAAAAEFSRVQQQQTEFPNSYAEMSGMATASCSHPENNNTEVEGDAPLALDSAWPGWDNLELDPDMPWDSNDPNSPSFGMLDPHYEGNINWVPSMFN